MEGFFDFIRAIGIIPAGSPRRAEHFPLHPPRIYALTRKPHTAQPGLIDAVQYLHQLGAFLSGFVLVKKVELSWPFGVKSSSAIPAFI
jgi:hypothetical protein